MRSRKLGERVGWGAIVVAGMVAIWLVVRTRSTAVHEAVGGVPPPPSGAAVGTVELPREDGTAALVHAPDEDAREAEPTSAPDPARAGLVVRVVERGNGLAVEGARVRALVAPAEDDAGDAFSLLDELEADDAAAAELVTDAKGEVRVATDEGCALDVLARKDGLAGVACFPAGEEARVLELVPDPDLVVQVLDAAGAGVEAVGVVLASTRGTQLSDETDAAGRARIPHLGLTIADEPESGWSVHPEVVLEEPPSVRIDRGALPREPIVFRLPATGSALVEVVDEAGAPLEESVSLRILAPGEPARRPLTPERRAHCVERLAEEGRARFPAVAVGSALEARVERFPEPWLDAAVACGPGPGAPGEEARLSVVVGAEDAVLLLRAVDAAGAPLAGADLDVGLRSESADSWSRVSCGTTLPTDAEGRVRVRVPADRTGRGTETIEVALERGSETWTGELPLAPSYPVGETDLGDLVLAPDPLAVSGTVVDELGSPVAGTDVQVESVATAQGASGTGLSESVGTDAGGRFALHARGAGRIAVSVWSAGRAAETVEIPFGTEGVVLVQPRAGAIAGRLLAAPGVPLEDLEVDAYPAGAEEQDEGGTWSVAPAEDGTFSFEDLPLGTAGISVQGADGELARVAGILVQAGETTRDPRLDPLDLRGKLFLHRIELVAPAGSELDGWVSCAPAGTPPPLQPEEEILGPSVVLATAAPSIDVLLAPSGFRREHLSAVGAGRRVVLRPALPVRLVLPAGTALPRAPFFLRAQLVPEAEASTWYESAESAFDADGALRTAAPDAGRVRVVWTLEYATEGSGRAQDVELGPTEILDVADSPAEQTFAVSFDPGALERELARMGGTTR